MAEPIRVIIMGAAGRDFHNFNTYFRDNELYNVVGFTAAQIPDIDQRALLTARYVHGDSFHRIQVQMGISERKVFRLHAAALTEAEKILKKTQKWQ